MSQRAPLQRSSNIRSKFRTKTSADGFKVLTLESSCREVRRKNHHVLCRRCQPTARICCFHCSPGSVRCSCPVSEHWVTPVSISHISLPKHSSALGNLWDWVIKPNRIHAAITALPLGYEKLPSSEGTDRIGHKIWVIHNTTESPRNVSSLLTRL